MTATRPPQQFPGLDPAWSRTVTAPDHRGIPTGWHLLDTRPEGAELTVLCVHGNPSWSYLFRHLAASAPPGVRLIAVDQLDMGFSERTAVLRRLGDRVEDLLALTDTLGLDGRVVTVAHDWGGPVSLGWALRRREQLAGVVLTNTAVHQPADAHAPPLIRIARSRALLGPSTVHSDLFVRGAMALSRRRYRHDVEAAFLAPYRTADRRRAIAEFVADIPLEDDHPTAATLDAIAAGLDDLSSVPALLFWGARDPVFSDVYLHDLEARLPHADVHRFATAGHFVTEDVDASTPIWDWVGQLSDRPRTVAAPAHSNTLSRPAGRITDPPLTPTDPGAVAAVVELGDDEQRSVSFDELHSTARSRAASIVAAGVQPGERIAVMIPPGIDLSVTVLACWHAGASVVLVDGALSPPQMHAAIRSAAPDHLIGIDRALVAARLLGWRARRIALASESRVSLLTRPEIVLADAAAAPAGVSVVHGDDDEAAIVFTSGSTGPSKGVRYSHGALIAQRDLIRAHYGITEDDRLVAAFAPFALFGPVLGIASAVPDIDVSAPATLTASKLAAAVGAVDATLVFASPASLQALVDTADELTERERSAFGSVRLLLSAGAPVSADVLRGAAEVLGVDSAHTPYGMTECLPVADIELAEIELAEIELAGIGSAGGGSGVCVGHPLPGVEVVIRPLDVTGSPSGPDTAAHGVLGEVVVRSPHQRTGYLRRWHTDYLASQPPGWHATGDVGSFDRQGRLWIGGRREHLITTEHGLVAPVGAEQQIRRRLGVARCAVVGVGPVGAQQVVAVCERTEVRRVRRSSGADAAAARSVAGVDLAAVLDVGALPVDRRHNSKIDRARVARWAADILAGRASGRWWSRRP